MWCCWRQPGLRSNPCLPPSAYPLLLSLLLAPPLLLLLHASQTRAFYECLPDIWALVPSVLLKDAPRSRASEAGADDAAEAATEPATEAAAAEQPPPSPPAKKGKAAAAASDAGKDDDDAAAAASDQPGGVDLALSRLPSCVSRDLCDELAVNFLWSNSKGGRKRLVRALVDVPRGNLQLLPYYARVAATISQAYPEVGQGAWCCDVAVRWCVAVCLCCVHAALACAGSEPPPRPPPHTRTHAPTHPRIQPTEVTAPPRTPLCQCWQAW